MPMNKTPETKISYAETFVCIDCGETFRIGMNPETDMYLNTEQNAMFGGHRCIFCYNLKSSAPCPVEWFVAVADRLEHENEIKAFVNLYVGEIEHSFFTDQKYRLVVQFDYQLLSERNIIQLTQTLEKDGMRCGEICSTYQHRYWQFTVDFADHEREFIR